MGLERRPVVLHRVVALARHRDDQGVVSRSGEVAARAEDVVSDAKQKSKKAAKSAKNKRKELAAAVAATGHRAADEIRDATERLDFDAKAAERDLKAAAWDAQQEAKEAESRLRAASHRVVDDATHIASWVGAEARNLAGEGKEKIAQLRHREEGEGSVEREVERLRAEIDELKDQLRKTGQKREKFPLGLTSRFTGKSGPSADRAHVAGEGACSPGSQEQSPSPGDSAKGARTDSARHCRSGSGCRSRQVGLDARIRWCPP